MRKVLIVGAGQAGLQLALSLQAEGYDVTVMSARTPDEIRNGWPTSTQVMMYRALDREREVKLNLWDGTATPIGGIGFNLSPAPGVSAFSFSGAWARPGNSVDQRLKMSDLDRAVRAARRPGDLPLGDDLGPGRPRAHVRPDGHRGRQGRDRRAVRPGRGEVPLHQAGPAPGGDLPGGIAVPDGVPHPRMRVSLRPGGGEYFHMPAYTHTGPCDVLLVEAVPGGPFDIFTDRPSPAEHLRRLRAMLLEHFPWEGRALRERRADRREGLPGRARSR